VKGFIDGAILDNRGLNYFCHYMLLYDVTISMQVVSLYASGITLNGFWSLITAFY